MVGVRLCIAASAWQVLEALVPPRPLEVAEPVVGATSGPSLSLSSSNVCFDPTKLACASFSFNARFAAHDEWSAALSAPPLVREAVAAAPSVATVLVVAAVGLIAPLLPGSGSDLRRRAGGSSSPPPSSPPPSAAPSSSVDAGFLRFPVLSLSAGVVSATFGGSSIGCARSAFKMPTCTAEASGSTDLHNTRAKACKQSYSRTSLTTSLFAQIRLSMFSTAAEGADGGALTSPSPKRARMCNVICSRFIRTQVAGEMAEGRVNEWHDELAAVSHGPCDARCIEALIKE